MQTIFHPCEKHLAVDVFTINEYNYYKISVFSCSESLVTHFLFLLARPDVDLIRSKQPDVLGQAHLTAQTPVWENVIASTSPEHREEHNQTVSPEAGRVHITQSQTAYISKVEWNQRAYNEEEALTLRPSNLPPQAGSGTDTGDCLWKQKQALLCCVFFRFSHD